MPHHDAIASGLSPRTRGNRNRHGAPRGRLGSIPANAGEPLGRDGGRPSARVYPRERGGTVWPIPKT